MDPKPEENTPTTIVGQSIEELAKPHGAVPFDASFCRYVNGIYVCDFVGKVALTSEQFNAIVDLK